MLTMDAQNYQDVNHRIFILNYAPFIAISAAEPRSTRALQSDHFIDYKKRFVILFCGELLEYTFAVTILVSVT